METIKDKVLQEYQKGNVVIAGVDGLMVTNMDNFIEQDTESLLYDLNRSEAVVLTFIEDPKWVNDFAVCKVIRALKQKVDELSKPAPDTTNLSQQGAEC